MTITIKELKDILKDWPDTTENGDPSEVWIETGRELSSPVTDFSRLGRGDFLLESDAFEDAEKNKCNCAENVARINDENNRVYATLNGGYYMPEVHNWWICPIHGYKKRSMKTPDKIKESKCLSCGCKLFKKVYRVKMTGDNRPFASEETFICWECGVELGKE